MLFDMRLESESSVIEFKILSQFTLKNVGIVGLCLRCGLIGIGSVQDYRCPKVDAPVEAKYSRLKSDSARMFSMVVYGDQLRSVGTDGKLITMDFFWCKLVNEFKVQNQIIV